MAGESLLSSALGCSKQPDDLNQERFSNGCNKSGCIACKSRKQWLEHLRDTTGDSEQARDLTRHSELIRGLARNSKQSLEQTSGPTGNSEQICDSTKDEKSNSVPEKGSNEENACIQEDKKVLGEENRKVTIINIGSANIVIGGKENLVFSADADNISYHTLTNVISNNPKVFPKALRRSGSFAGKRYSLIMAKTQHLTDNGLSDKFFHLTNILLRETTKKDNDLHVLTLQQQAIFHLYGNQLESARGELDKALQLSEKCQNHGLLRGRSYTYIAYTELYQRQYESALENLEKAKYLLAFCVSGEEKSMVCYLFGCVYMKQAAEVTCLTAKVNFEAKALEFFYLYVRHAKEDSETELRVKNLQYGLFKQVTIHLRTYSKESYHFPVDKTKVDKAKEILDYFELNLWKCASLSAKIHYGSLKADYFFRRGRYERCRDMLGSALREAKEIRHQPLINMVTDRMNVLEDVTRNKND